MPNRLADKKVQYSSDHVFPTTIMDHGNNTTTGYKNRLTLYYDVRTEQSSNKEHNDKNDAKIEQPREKGTE